MDLARMKNILAVIAILFICNTAYSAEDTLERELVQRISTAKSKLEKTQSQISSESQTLARKLNAKQDELVKLREQAAAVQRLAEEKTLSLESLQTRIDQWQAQSQYQQHLITAYVEKNNLDSNQFAKVDGQPSYDVQAVLLALERTTNLLSPKWTSRDVVNSAGQIESLSSLAIGPVQVALDGSGGDGGLVAAGLNNLPYIQSVYHRDQAAELFSIKESGVGLLAFDPTLGNAYQLNNQQGNLIGHIKQGGIWAIPILFFGFLSLVIALLKGGQLVRLPKVETSFFDRIARELERGAELAIPARERLQKAKEKLVGVQKQLLEIVSTAPVSPQRDDLMIACLRENKHNIERFMGVVATSAAIAPLLGLLGTVSGMINTFKMMTIFGAGDAATVSGGISEALVTTELGLIVAIPSLIVSALLTRKTKSYNHKLETLAIKLSKVNV
ncbi:biopolymer transport protein ExbB [Alteromonadaceae bacterium 2753L.S.0a.02]|nr:biopolymer transport protein ExbB [Alteromonadaceae bacterium 2753L.S.0a.02]